MPDSKINVKPIRLLLKNAEVAGESATDPALLNEIFDALATSINDSYRRRFTVSAGRVDASLVEVLWTTPGFDHCMFDALPTLGDSRVRAFQEALFRMSWEDPAHARRDRARSPGTRAVPRGTTTADPAARPATTSAGRARPPAPWRGGRDEPKRAGRR